MANKLTLQTVFEAVDHMAAPMKTMRGSVSKFGSDSTASLTRVGDSMSRIGSAIKGAVAVIATGAAAKAMTDFAERGDDIARNASILGLTATAYQELAYAAKMADVDQDAFAAATKKLNNSLGQLRLREGSLYTTLAKTNPKLASQLRYAKTTDEAFSLLAASIAGETNIQKRATLAQAAFGKSGQELIPMMQGLADARKDAHNAGAIMSDDEVRQAERLDETLKGLKVTGMGLANEVLSRIAEKVSPIIERMTEWVRTNKDLIDQRIDQVFGAISSAMRLVSDGWTSGIIPATLLGIAVFKALQGAVLIFGGIQAAVKLAGAAVFAFQAYAGGAATAMEALNLVMSANPVGVILTAVAAIAGLIYLIVKNWDKISGFFKSIFGGKKAEITIDGKPSSAYGASRDYAEGGAPQSSSGAIDPLYAPVSPNTVGIESRTYAESRSTVDIDLGNLPAGSSVRQSGRAPGVSLNLGPTAVSGGPH